MVERAPGWCWSRWYPASLSFIAPWGLCGAASGSRSFCSMVGSLLQAAEEPRRGGWRGCRGGRVVRRRGSGRRDDHRAIGRDGDLVGGDRGDVRLLGRGEIGDLRVEGSQLLRLGAVELEDPAGAAGLVLDVEVQLGNLLALADRRPGRQERLKDG